MINSLHKAVEVVVFTSVLCPAVTAADSVSARNAPRSRLDSKTVVSSSPCLSTPGNRLYSFNGVPGFPAIFVFPVSAQGHVKPICTIAAPGLNANYGGATVDVNGKLWVDVQPLQSGFPSLLSFPRGANGGVQPLQVISGSNILILATGGYSQEPGTDAIGNLWVPVLDGLSKGYLVEFAANANGNVAPIQTVGHGDDGVSEGLDDPASIAFDHEGNMWVGGLQQVVAVFAPPFSDTSKPCGFYIGIDARDDVFVANATNLLILFYGLRGKRWRTISLPNGSIGIAVGKKHLFNALATGSRAIDVLPPRPTTYDPIRQLTSPAFSNAPELPALGL